VWLAPKLLGNVAPALWVSLAALFVVLICASFGQAVLQFAGARIRSRITWQPVRALDAIGGAALSMAAVLVVAWALGVAVSGAKLPWASSEVRSSAVLDHVDGVMPAEAVQALGSFNAVVGSSFFPRYLEPFARERIVDVGPPPGRIGRDPDVRRAADSVYKVRGENVCQRGVEGSGFLYGKDAQGRARVMTNAHVVAGVRKPDVLVGEREVSATVVYYNPDIDVAVLAVDGLKGKQLRFDPHARPRQPAAVLGYPQDGPYDVQAARLRGEQRLRSPDIYGDGAVVRQVYSLRSLVRPGNSGGPLVSSAGRVLGVIFAASVTDGSTGYALTAGQVADAAASGLTRSRGVSTGGCA
jgi:S1-C subfamily serine protease